MTKNIDSRFFLPKPSLGVHAVHGFSFRLRIPLVRELFYKNN